MISSFFIGWYVTGNLMGGLKFTGWIVLINTILYYFHERIWHHYEKKQRKK